ncbi:MAG: hypothetical protein KDK55_00915 [Chlamydiia bacterium]|nr:hypothetical protein [Chlamydiia bacterium]
MELQKKAAYNLLLMNLPIVLKEEAEGTPYTFESWQKEDFRTFPEERLFEELAELGFSLNPKMFEEISEKYDTPEDLFKDLTKGWKDGVKKDHAYLLFFELWRRFVPEKQSLSIICDELENLICLYNRGDSTISEALQDQLATVQSILEENVDAGVDPKTVFLELQSYLANDLENFIYHAILDQIENENGNYALELLEGFDPFVEDTHWFAYLRGRALALKDPEEGFALLEKLIEEKHLSVQLNLEMLLFLAEESHHLLFLELAKKTLPMLELEEDLIDYMMALLAFYGEMGRKEPQKKLQALIEKRKTMDEETPLDHNDQIFYQLRELLPRISSSLNKKGEKFK